MIFFPVEESGSTVNFVLTRSCYLHEHKEMGQVFPIHVSRNTWAQMSKECKWIPVNLCDKMDRQTDPDYILFHVDSVNMKGFDSALRRRGYCTVHHVGIKQQEGWTRDGRNLIVSYQEMVPNKAVNCKCS
jgi:hypothetical protein